MSNKDENNLPSAKSFLLSKVDPNTPMDFDEATNALSNCMIEFAQMHVDLYKEKLLAECYFDIDCQFRIVDQDSIEEIKINIK